MKKNIVESYLNHLDNILEDVNELIGKPSEFDNSSLGGPELHPTMAWLLDRDMRLALFETHPTCFLPIKKGRLIPFLPVCNRMGATDKTAIRMSLKIAECLKDHTDIDQDHLAMVIEKLTTMLI